MNPSASGWIKKHLPIFTKEILAPHFSDRQFYEKIKSTGFIYANSTSTLSYTTGTTYPLTIEEISKINLFDSLGFVYFQSFPKASSGDFIKSAVAFYAYLKRHSWFDFQLPFIKISPEEKLEKIIDHRIRTNQDFFRKNFSTLITNALLYLDVLTFAHFLETEANPIDYATTLEALLANTVYLSFKQKSDKSTHEKLVLKLLDMSIRYNPVAQVSLPYKELNYDAHQLPLECEYLLDLACMTIYADQEIDQKEQHFIEQLGQTLGFSETEVATHITAFKAFVTKHKEKITYMDYSSPFKNLFDNTKTLVRNLILRNKKRLTREIKQSGALVILLKKSTTTSLTEEEEQIVRTQLLDICKIIPSLGIFLLPGGSILLPILINFIPELLPSAFADNR